MSDSRATGKRARSAMAGLGIVVGGTAVAFVVRRLVSDWPVIRPRLGEAHLGWLGAAVLLAAIGMVLVALPWRAAVRALGGDLGRRQVVSRYFLGELGKYLPGGVWPVMGRGELARRAGVRPAAAYGSVALSLVTLYLSAAVVVLLGLPILLRDETSTSALLALLVVPAGGLALHPAVLRTLVRAGERLLRRPLHVVIPGWGTSASLVARYVPAWTTIGTATWAVARAFDPGASWQGIVVATAASWLAGFAAVPVPGGVGVREAVFVGAAGGSMDPAMAALVALVARFLFIAVDVGGAAGGALGLRPARPPGGQPAISDADT